MWFHHLHGYYVKTKMAKPNVIPIATTI